MRFTLAALLACGPLALASPVARGDVADRIFDAIYSKVYHDPRFADEPKHVEPFLGNIKKAVAADEPVRMFLPAFPDKSRAVGVKVLGLLPDRGEEIALQTLNSIAESVTEVYPRGAEVLLAADGLVFNDVLNVKPETVWEYTQEVEGMIKRNRLSNVRIVQPQELLPADELEDANFKRQVLRFRRFRDRKDWMDTADQTRQYFVDHFGKTKAQIEDEIAADPNTKSTYVGFKEWLNTEVQADRGSKSKKQWEKYRGVVAKNMMIRSEVFTNALLALRPTYVRLSSHPSNLKGKLSIQLIPQDVGGRFPPNPWSSAVVEFNDGSIRSTYEKELKAAGVSYEVKHEHGRPWYIKADGWWSTKKNAPVREEPDGNESSAAESSAAESSTDDASGSSSDSDAGGKTLMRAKL